MPAPWARQYSSGIGRFLTHDPMMGDMNAPISQHRYLYAGNNPVNGIDPSGEETLMSISFSSSFMFGSFELPGMGGGNELPVQPPSGGVGGGWQIGLGAAYATYLAVGSYYALSKGSQILNAHRIETEIELEENDHEDERNDQDDAITYFRVQGGGSKYLVHFDVAGNVNINPKDVPLNLSVGTSEHAEFFQTLRRPGGRIYEFKVPKWFHAMVMENAVAQAFYNMNPQNQEGIAPKITDSTTLGLTLEFNPPLWHQWIEEVAISGSGKVR